MSKIESSLVLVILLILILKDSNGILKSEDIPALENNSEPCESISEELPVSIASIVSIVSIV